MKRNWSGVSIAVVVLGVVAHVAGASQPVPGTSGAVRRVTEFTVPAPLAFQRVDDRFKRLGPLAAGAVKLPAPVLEESSKGYVLVASATGPVWLDKLDVTLVPRKAPATMARCGPAVTSAADTTVAAVRGAGEGCK